MNRFSFLKFSSIIFFCLCTLVHGQEIKKTTEALLRNQFGKSTSLKEQKYTIPATAKKKAESAAKQKFNNSFIYIYTASVNGAVKGYGFLDNVQGKAMPITFLVIFDTKGNILSSAIVKYREQYGGEVADKNWNKQFKGKNSSSDFTVGKSIDAISGATISVNSVTRGIKKLAVLFREIF
ncbi:MAG: FMN-binding protein [Ignavibacteriales bacterium]|nr:MAG: FMN-binding protein [Ignavibacteriaceae bacterium]MBW7872563.1 FMN-binding protein [Ignavibacteria bacterium]MCZ2141884.1 FMN-binding protein [Ignavibacteriales bacterium]MBV6445051.1 Electron transport complex subunit RsxG [Ignavibacteriaceae bacterium]MBZ0196654.1 FMN-binding protein [Ignavibacteriaceae bacterium]